MKKTTFSAFSILFFLSCIGQNSVGVENLGSNVNSKYSELSPIISADGKVLYFIVESHPDNSQQQVEKITQDIWYSEKGADGKWSKAIHAAEPLNQIAVNSVYGCHQKEIKY